MSYKCILCFCDHERVRDGEPSLYCEPCAGKRQATRGVVSHVIDTLYLADMAAAAGFDGARMCVHEHGPKYTGQCHFIPILTKRPNSDLDRSGAVASPQALDEAAELIDSYMQRGERLLVHCQGGVERSPLTIAWYLVKKAKRFGTFEEAYAFLKQQRPVVSERLFWLEPSNRE